MAERGELGRLDVIVAIVVLVQIADEELFDLLQWLVLRFGHARVQVKGSHQCYGPVDDEQAGQGAPALHGQKRFGEDERHQKRQRGRQSAGDASAPG